jgi:hypothetical protein
MTTQYSKIELNKNPQTPQSDRMSISRHTGDPFPSQLPSMLITPLGLVSNFWLGTEENLCLGPCQHLALRKSFDLEEGIVLTVYNFLAHLGG